MTHALYHCSVSLYAPGDLITPGSWGRRILGLGPQHTRFYAEYALEMIRRADFPSRPSRMSACFAFEHCDKAMRFRRDEKAPQEHIYLVTLERADALAHRGNTSWIDIMSKYRTFGGINDCASHYWQGDDRDPDAWEWIVAGSLIVQDRLTRIEENGAAPDEHS